MEKTTKTQSDLLEIHMLDDGRNHKTIEIFVITNGRKTFPFTIKSLTSQTSAKKITVIRDKIWVDALNECVRLCKSDFYLRVDDDMFLHPCAVEYYEDRLFSLRRVGVYECKFWEDWSNKPAGSLKAYNIGIARRLKFRPNKLGKVDKVFSSDLLKTKFRRIRDKSMIGLHACASIRDQKKYRILWRDKNTKITRKEFSKTFDNKIHHYDQPLKKQYESLNKICKLNKKYKTNFYYFIMRKKKAL